MTRLVALQRAEPMVLRDDLDAVWAAGHAALPLDPAAPDHLVARLLADLRPAELRTDGGTRTRAARDLGAWQRAQPAPVPDGTALVIATSGSTGAPRGVVLSHDALATATRLSRTRLGAADGVPWLGVLPLHHVAGISVLLRSRAAGREPELHRRDTPEVVAAAEPSWISLVPVQLRRLLDAGADLARHHGVLLGGAAAPAELLSRAAARGVHVVTSYGATETCGGCVHDGVPLDRVEARTDGDDRIQLRTPTIATGVRLPDGEVAPLVDDEGWWTTTDLGAIVDGRLQVLGRADDVVVSGGENVPLGPVRDALAELAGIAASAVVGLPHDTWGTAVTAVVVPAGPPPSLAEVRTALASRLPRSHLPTVLVVADQLPSDGLGKTTPATVLAAVDRAAARLDRT